jgi:hypothetical protein
LDYSQVSFNKTMLSLTAPQGDNLSFNKGELLQGTVQEVKDDGLVLLFIKGKLVEAASEVLVKTGQQLYLMVDEYRDGKTYLKVVTPQLLNDIENSNLSANLRSQGWAGSPDNIQMARKLLDYNLPVTASNLGNISRAAKMLGGYNHQNLETAVFALSRNIGPNQAALNAVAQLISHKASDVLSLFRDAIQVLNLLNTADNALMDAAGIKLTEDSGRLPGKSNWSSQSQQIGLDRNLTVETAGHNLSEGSQTANPKLEKPWPTSAGAGRQEQANHSSLQPGVSLNDLPDQGVKLNSAAISGSENLLNANSGNIEDPVGTVQKLLDSLILQADRSPEETASKLANLIKSQNITIKSLRVLADLLGSSSGNLTETLKKVASRLEGLEREITGQRLFNMASSLPGEGVLNNYYFAVPVQLGNELHLCQLKIHRDSKRPLQMNDNIRFIVSLDTRNLGMVLFYVDWKRSGELNLQGVVENHTALQQMNDNSRTLTARLQALGYSVNFSGIKIARPEELCLRPELGEKPSSAVRSLGIDVII